MHTTLMHFDNLLKIFTENGWIYLHFPFWPTKWILLLVKGSFQFIFSQRMLITYNLLLLIFAHSFIGFFSGFLRILYATDWFVCIWNYSCVLVHKIMCSRLGAMLSFSGKGFSHFLVWAPKWLTSAFHFINSSEILRKIREIHIETDSSFWIIKCYHSRARQLLYPNHKSLTTRRTQKKPSIKLADLFSRLVRCDVLCAVFFGAELVAHRAARERERRKKAAQSKWNEIENATILRFRIQFHSY